MIKNQTVNSKPQVQGGDTGRREENGSSQWDVGSVPAGPPPLVPMEGVGPGGTLVFEAEIIFSC